MVTLKKNKKIVKVKKKSKITKSLTFSKLMNKFPESAEILFEHGMHCIGCPMSMNETLAEGAIAHGLDPNKLVNELNKKLKLD